MSVETPRGLPAGPVAEAIYTLAALELQLRENLPPNVAAQRVASQRNEIRYVLAGWAPPPDSYRSEDLATPHGGVCPYCGHPNAGATSYDDCPVRALEETPHDH
jgi:hypothetical protein